MQASGWSNHLDHPDHVKLTTVAKEVADGISRDEQFLEMNKFYHFQSQTETFLSLLKTRL